MVKPHDVDIAASVVDWVIDYPESAAVFREFGIESCCAGLSLEQACLRARAHPSVVCARLADIVKRAEVPARPISDATQRQE